MDRASVFGLTGYHFDPSHADALQERVENLRSLVTEYAWLTEMHIVDFFVEDHWQRLPQVWREEFDGRWYGTDDSLDDLVRLAALGEIWPGASPSLRAFAGTCQALALDRSAQIVPQTVNKPPDPRTAGESQETPRPTAHWAPPIDERVVLGMNPKKVVEVEHLAYFISQLARREEVGLIADLGAGQGYLSRTLVYQYDHPVLAIDSNQIQTCGAERQLQRTEKFVNKTKKPLSASGDQISPGDAPTNSPAPVAANGASFTLTGRPAYLKHITCYIDTDNLTQVAGFVQEAQRTLTTPPYMHPMALQQPWLVCGLHACGNLSNVMLKWFVKSTAKCVVNVGCCYNMMGLTEGTISYCPFFPISQELTHKGATLSVNALKLACQAPTRWADQTTTAIGNFERHYFRALLHYAMVDRGLVQPNDPFPVVGRLSKTAFANFSTYAQRALRRLGHPIPNEPERGSPTESTPTATGAALPEAHHGPAQLSNSPLKVGDLAYYDTKLRPQAARMAIVWTLKALLSPCIESLIILDRCLYLVEQGCQVDLVPLVDPNVSPRNIVIMATK
ncbi:hypothetical protein H4R33_001481 [Dimargaris cristalligena]|nr:hypothetical protein H4R33_001481 [Dimargaris cristalligena]